MSARTVGNVTFDFIEPDILKYTWKGSTGEAEVIALQEYAEEMIRAHGPTQFLLIDVREAGAIHPSARKRIGHLSKAQLWQATVIYGASFPVRVTIELIINAAKIVQPNATDTAFVADEPAALAWLAGQRAKLK